MTDREESIRVWRAAGERGDAAALQLCLSPDVELISPLTSQFRLVGREEVVEVFEAAFECISGIRFHTEVGDSDVRALFYRADVGDLRVEEAQLLRLDKRGLIGEVTLFGRPLPGLTAVMAGIGPRLLRRRGRRALAQFVGAAGASLALVTRKADQQTVRLLGDHPVPARGGARPRR